MGEGRYWGEVVNRGAVLGRGGIGEERGRLYLKTHSGNGPCKGISVFKIVNFILIV